MILNAAYLLAEGAFLRWYRGYRKTMPSLRAAPAEIRAAFRRYAAGAVLVLGVGCGVYLALGPLVCAAVTFVLVTAGLALYESHYASAAAATRARLRYDA